MPCWGHFLSTRAFALVFHWDSVPNFSFVGVVTPNPYHSAPAIPRASPSGASLRADARQLRREHLRSNNLLRKYPVPLTGTLSPYCPLRLPSYRLRCASSRFPPFALRSESHCADAHSLREILGMFLKTRDKNSRLFYWGCQPKPPPKKTIAVHRFFPHEPLYVQKVDTGRLVLSYAFLPPFLSLCIYLSKLFKRRL